MSHKYLHSQKEYLAEKLRNFRKLRGFTQKELAKGICSQSTISQAESEIDIPNGIILHQLCQRLQINLNSLFEEIHEGWDDEIDLFKEKCEEQMKSHINLDMSEFLNKNRHIYKYGDESIKQYYLIVESSCETIKGNHSYAIELIEKALSMNNYNTPNAYAQKINAYATYALIYNSIKENHKILPALKDGFELLDRINTLKFSTIKIKFHIAYALGLFYKAIHESYTEDESELYLERYKSVVDTGIDICISTKNFYHLDNLYYLKTNYYNYSKKINNSEAISIILFYLNKSLTIAEISNNIEVYEKVNSKIKEIQNRVNPFNAK